MAEEKMHAVVIYGKEDFRYEEVPKPKPKEGEILVKIERCGICAADPKIYHGKAYFSKIVYDHAPIIAGHEFIGEVVELGPGAKERHGVDVGDRAIMENIVPCGECYYCRRGMYNLCIPHLIPGVKINGGWADYMIYPKNAIVHKVPKDMPVDAAVLIEPFACAIHGVELGEIGFEDVVVLLGAGPIGSLMISAIKQKNPKLLIVSEPDPHRRSVAKELGADIVVNPIEEDLVARVMEETDNIGADVVIDASGSPKAVEAGINALRKQGRYVEFGVFAEKTCIDFSIISDIKELRIVGGHLGPYTYPAAIRLLHQGYVKYDKIVTHNIPLKDWRKAIDVAERKLEGAIKVTMTP